MISPIGKRSRDSGRGFTLIELLIAVIIIGLLIGVSIPSLSASFTDLQLNNSGKNIIWLMRYAQQRAVMERSRYRLNFDIEAGKYWITFQEESSERYIKVEGSLGRQYRLPKGIFIKRVDPSILLRVNPERSRRIDFLEELQGPSKEYITFCPDGTVDKVSIELSNDKGKSLVISTEITGRIEIVGL